MAAQAPASTRPLARLLTTDESLAPTILRLALAVTMFPHGAQKLLGWFGGYGFEGTMGFLTEQIGMPWVAALGVVMLEFFGPLLLLVGLGTRLIGLGFAGIMVGAVATVHLSHGFFMNWSGQQAGEGFEYHLLVIGMSLALAVTGAGRWSLDKKLST
jgi:putative oxidoreductase